MLTDHDIYLFREGKHGRLYAGLGCQLGSDGAAFAVWAPNAARVSVIGDFNDWDPSADPLANRNDGSGIWEGFVPGVGRGDALQVPHRIALQRLRGRQGRSVRVLLPRLPPRDRVARLDARLRLAATTSGCAARRRATRSMRRMSIYEVHLGSWRARRGQSACSRYREHRAALADYVSEMGFTHVELMPVMEHPFYGSWGYQITGYFAPTSRYGTPQDFMFLVDHLHQHGIGVILDWVPSHFPGDEHGLAYFDGTHLYEHADPRQGFHPEWNSYIFNYGRNEVRAFLLSAARCSGSTTITSTACAWTRVASMLYLDYGRKAGEWIPNQHGGRENLEAVEFLRAAQRGGLSRSSRRADDRRGIDRLADGVASDLRRRAGLRHEVEHGLDARHARLLRAGSDPPQVPPRTSSLSASGTPSPRTSCCRCRTTRSSTARAR